MSNKLKKVLPGSRIYFHQPTENAMRMFFYPICCGVFSCEPGYMVRRTNYESFLILLVKRGKGYLKVSDHKYVLEQGMVAIVDCYQPHSYGTTEGWDILWVHIDGNHCRDYYEWITSENQGIFTIEHKSDFEVIENTLSKILNSFTQEIGKSEMQLSLHITEILTQLYLSESEKLFLEPKTVIEQSVSYIHQHFKEPLGVESLAQNVSLSTYYYIRSFKKETGYTPYQYVNRVRINSAKYYLRTTNSTIKEVAYLCGFQSENNFCIHFRNQIHMTPSEYRKLEFI